MAEQLATEGDWGGPYIQAATFCEAVLVEQGNAVPTVVRMAGRASAGILVADPTPEQLAGVVVELTFFLLLQTGNALDGGRLTLDLTRPTGHTQREFFVQEITWPQPSTDETRAETTVRIVNRIRMGADLDGLIWMDIRYDGRLLTRVPMRLDFHPTPTP